MQRKKFNILFKRKKTLFFGYPIRRHIHNQRKGCGPMSWVYWVKLHESKFQAGCLAKRMEEDWWIYGYECPRTVEVFRSKKGRFGVRYILELKRD
jgi:hypothetical protein